MGLVFMGLLPTGRASALLAGASARTPVPRSGPAGRSRPCSVRTRSVPARPGGHPSSSSSSSRSSSCPRCWYRAVVPAAARPGSTIRPPAGGGGGGLLRAHRRIHVRAAADQAVRRTYTRTTSGEHRLGALDGTTLVLGQPVDHLSAGVPYDPVAAAGGRHSRGRVRDRSAPARLRGAGRADHAAPRWLRTGLVAAFAKTLLTPGSPWPRGGLLFDHPWRPRGLAGVARSAPRPATASERPPPGRVPPAPDRRRRASRSLSRASHVRACRSGVDAFRRRLRRPPRAGLVFDLDTGEVLCRPAACVLPMASLPRRS